MNCTITLITGGHGSGKTAYALNLSAGYNQKLYLATAEPLDDEMRSKITAHIAERDNTYCTIEEPLDIHGILTSDHTSDVVLLDCITLWVGNLLHYQKDTDAYMADFIASLDKLKKDLIIITNESSLSLIPADSLSRKYLKIISIINREIAKKADKVYMMVSGIPIKLK